jgi:hypothetical protein
MGRVVAADERDGDGDDLPLDDDLPPPLPIIITIKLY